MNKFLPTKLQNITALKILFFILAFAAILRIWSLEQSHHHPDEVISIEVAQMVATTGNFDTNWKLAPLPDYFKYPQYNFSAYLLSASVFAKIAQLFAPYFDIQIKELLRYYSMILGLSIVALIFLLGRQLHNTATGLCAAFIAAAAPLLYQDSLYARPETFVTALTLLYVYLPGQDNLKLSLRIFVASFILGLLIATKISLLAFAPMIALLVMPAQSFQQESYFKFFFQYVKTCLISSLRYSPLILLGMIVGFFIGVPYAVTNYNDFLYGAERLLQQYNGGHWPHGLPDGSLMERFNYSIQYFANTSGYFLFIFSFIGCFAAFKTRNLRAGFIFILALIFAIRFSTYPVFFERNLSHILPFFIISAAYGITYCAENFSFKLASKSLLTAIVLLITAYPGYKTSYNIAAFELTDRQSKRVKNMRENFESDLGVPAIQLVWIRDYDSIKSHLPTKCQPVLLQYSHAGDKYSMHSLEQLKTNDGYKEIGSLPSRFKNVPPSTLHTYFTPHALFLYKDATECNDG